MGILKCLHVDTFLDQRCIALMYLLQQLTSLSTQGRNPLAFAPVASQQHTKLTWLKVDRMVMAFEEIREFFYYCTASSALPLQLNAVLPADLLEGGQCHPDLLQRWFVILQLEQNLLPSAEVSLLRTECTFLKFSKLYFSSSRKSLFEAASQSTCLPQPCLLPCSLQLLQLFSAAGGKAGEMSAAEKPTVVIDWMMPGQN